MNVTFRPNKTNKIPQRNYSSNKIKHVHVYLSETGTENQTQTQGRMKWQAGGAIQKHKQKSRKPGKQSDKSKAR